MCYEIVLSFTLSVIVLIGALNIKDNEYYFPMISCLLLSRLLFAYTNQIHSNRIMNTCFSVIHEIPNLYTKFNHKFAVNVAGAIVVKISENHNGQFKNVHLIITVTSAAREFCPS